MRPLRILQIIEFLTPRMGGTPQVVYQISRYLARQGHDVTVWASDYGGDARFPDISFEMVLFPCVSSRSHFYVTPALIGWTRKHIGDFDIVHMHDARTFQNLVVGEFARRRGIPYVLSAHGSMPLLAEHTAAKRVYDLFWGRQLVKEAKRLVAVSAVEVDQYLEAGIPPEKIALIPNGLDLEEFSQLPPRGSFRAQFGIPPESQMVLSLGRLHRIKGLDHLIAAFGTLRRDLPNAVLMLAGPDDGDLARLRKIAAEAHLQEQVLFPGPLYGPNRLAAFVDADLLAAPSEHEIFGLSPFEALMCGTPAVVTQDTGAGRLIREAGAGYLVPYGDDDALASAMLEALADRAEAERRVASGQAFVQKRLRWESIVGELEALYTAEIAEPAAKASVSV